MPEYISWHSQSQVTQYVDASGKIKLYKRDNLVYGRIQADQLSYNWLQIGTLPEGWRPVILFSLSGDKPETLIHIDPTGEVRVSSWKTAGVSDCGFTVFYFVQ